MPFISVIIPIYNVEKYLEQCLYSVLDQTYTDWEAILVDDGSPDSCPGICDAYAARDSRFKVIHKSNGGISETRNDGMKEASGEYIYLLDADDYLLPNAFQSLVTCAEAHDNPDYIKGNHLVLLNDGNIVKTRFTPPTTI